MLPHEQLTCVELYCILGDILSPSLPYPGVVHLSGYLVLEEPEEMDFSQMSASEEEEEESEEEEGESDDEESDEDGKLYNFAKVTSRIPQIYL